MTGFVPTLAQVDEMHRKIAPSPAAYDLIHTHCVIIATITRELVRRQNALFTRRCTLPKNAPELTGGFDPLDGGLTVKARPEGRGASGAVNSADAKDTHNASTSGASGAVPAKKADGMPATVTPATIAKHVAPVVPPTDGVRGGTVPPRLLDENLAVVGAMLHDIGTYLVLRNDGSNGGKLQFDGPNYILHGVRGYDYLLGLGVDESIAQFARNHTGVGLTREQVVSQHLPLPPADYVPMNLEQEVVMVADKYNSKSIPPRFLTAEAYARKARRFGEKNERAWRDLVVKYGVPDIAGLAKRFKMKCEV
ncbi:HD domain-containing protein [Bifidobacterium sp. ESL0763]|uniref:HD domain-containing protein n=1 Tax=Bifidobacterium sp. ESL0763 TaxID=2983227 RepID=UPI0023FA4584|nr:HD domain-containing protein [Bifidobacterium sp. ESL0763]MDF7664429.1 HD domain-containing protein [Bifidobacterium sp. ESL0763]